MEFILNNIDTIGALMISLMLVIWAIVTRQWSVLQVAAYRLMLSAERLMGTKQGKAKMEMVYAALWQQVPKWLKKFVTEKTLREKLQEWYNIAKNSLGGNAEETEIST